MNITVDNGWVDMDFEGKQDDPGGWIGWLATSLHQFFYAMDACLVCLIAFVRPKGLLLSLFHRCQRS